MPHLNLTEFNTNWLKITANTVCTEYNINFEFLNISDLSCVLNVKGLVGLGRSIWQPFVHADGRVSFTHSSPHLEDGYPGHLFSQVTYTYTY